MSAKGAEISRRQTNYISVGQVSFNVSLLPPQVVVVVVVGVRVASGTSQ